MNQLVQELAKQAYEDVIRNTPSFLVTRELYEKRFAELIIQECIEVCNNQATYDPQTLPYKPSKQFADAIKQHFEIET